MAAEALTDQEQQFRKRARRRLIGAVALVLLMVTVLPMLLDDRSDQAPRPDVAISIPSQDDGNFASKIVPTAPPANTVPVASAVAPQASTPPAALPQPTAAPVVAEPKPEPKVEPLPEPKPKAEPKPEIKPKTESKQKPEAKLEPAKPMVVEQPKPEPKMAPATVEKNVPAKNESVSIQVGVFTDSDKVTQMKNKAGSLGIKCGTEPLNTKTGAKVRMRCGPYASRVEAEKAQEGLKAVGINNTILVSHQ